MANVFRMLIAVLASACALSCAGCSKSNIFSWTHTPGSNSDSAALSSDALTALNDKDYAKAIEYYTKLLEADPASAEAIYGYAVATLADAGLDVATLVSNLIKQQAGAPAHLSPALAAVALTSSNTTNILPQSIIDNLAKIRAAIDKVLAADKLPKIVKGLSDGKIDADNPDVNLNLAFCLILRAATRVQDSGLITFDTDYNAIIDSSATAGEISMVVNDSLKDIASAYHRYVIVLDKLNLASDSQIAQIKDDITALFNDLKTEALSKGVTITADINQDYL
jgi:tetratricopeptide (TPR) repeat protein